MHNQNNKSQAYSTVTSATQFAGKTFSGGGGSPTLRKVVSWSLINMSIFNRARFSKSGFSILMLRAFRVGKSEADGRSLKTRTPGLVWTESRRFKEMCHLHCDFWAGRRITWRVVMMRERGPRCRTSTYTSFLNMPSFMFDTSCWPEALRWSKAGGLGVYGGESASRCAGFCVVIGLASEKGVFAYSRRTMPSKGMNRGRRTRSTFVNKRMLQV